MEPSKRVRDSDRDTVAREITEFIQTEFAATTTIDHDTPLITQGIVDSIGVLRLVRFLEDRFQVNVQAQDLVLQNFRSVTAMLDLVINRSGD
ncbi:MAG: acyl carrier protein [Acidobacteria bacterium]|nr:MAG: acyl carrier protein [Acidobacteriota bacterium]